MEEERKRELLDIARRAIADPAYRPRPSMERFGAFVTLRKGGSLRGCIGVLYPIADLSGEIARLARDAAFGDPRFQPLQPDELPLCSIEISLLTEPEDIPGPEEFIPGRDGIILTCHDRRAVFLPQVADETGWGREEMLAALSEKAGLQKDAWKEAGARFQTFQAEAFSEDDL